MYNSIITIIKNRIGMTEELTKQLMIIVLAIVGLIVLVMLWQNLLGKTLGGGS